MLAKIILLSNQDEIEAVKTKAEVLGINTNIQEEIYKHYEFGFDIESVDLYYLIKTGDIVIRVNGEFFDIKYDKAIHDQLKEKFK